MNEMPNAAPTPDNSARKSSYEEKIVDFEDIERDILEYAFPEPLDLADLEASLIERYDLDHESEPYRAIKKHSIELLESGLSRYGEGQTSIYYTIDNTVSRIPRTITDKVGVLRVRTENKRNWKTGQKFESIFSTKEKARPLDEFMHGAVVQGIAHLKPGVLVPKPYFIVEKSGAFDSETGKLIPGTEESVTGAYLIMEHIPGLTPLQICDPDGSLQKEFLNMRKNSDYSVWQRHKDKIRTNIRRVIEENPYLLEMDFDAALAHLEGQVESLHATTGNIPGILHRDLHDGNVVIHPEKKLFYIIDFGEAKVSYADEEFGKYYDDYENAGKSIPGRPAFYMPDGPYEFKSADNLRKPTNALEHIGSFLFQIKEVVKEMR
ncbi:MAG: phosphotransferase [Candidatus Moranbacteria bacterium]|nr:phosphotransferase [Candidatus Moranbacteria bacterium]